MPIGTKDASTNGKGIKFLAGEAPMACYLRKWLYATILLALLYFLKIPMCGQSADSLGSTPQVAQSQPPPQPPKQIDDQSTSNQPQAQDSGGKHSDSDVANKTHFRLGSVTVGAAYTHFPNSYYAGLWPYSFYPYHFYPLALGYQPFYYGYPLLYAPYVPDLVYGLGKGEVKLAAEPKTASVYLNGAYAGTARDLKSMWLEPGAYDLSLSAPGQQEFHQRIYVLSGKSLKIAAKLAPATGQKPEKSPEKSEDKQ
jgi:hypothetical protein